MHVGGDMTKRSPRTRNQCVGKIIHDKIRLGVCGGTRVLGHLILGTALIYGGPLGYMVGMTGPPAGPAQRILVNLQLYLYTTGL